MRLFLLFLLGSALCLHTADCLKCYTCIGAQKNSDCLQETTCSPESTHCMTNVASGAGQTVITKQCVPGCKPNQFEHIGLKASVSCCQTDLCNYSGASLRISYLTLFISVGFVGSLLRAGL
ncbi:lymphocyte antigen 6E [Microcaecilia unicolor]|uniref:Lymphocyte antigen 6E-like n=1 Tax=Microcaecilia unicolor TaxID=1415580 RepID=A0A6P7ZLR4_9AMPH|nr:lymphocyte antigen 6E-like [Microcaecilia unicolor]